MSSTGPDPIGVKGSLALAVIYAPHRFSSARWFNNADKTGGRFNLGSKVTFFKKEHHASL